MCPEEGASAASTATSSHPTELCLAENLVIHADLNHVMQGKYVVLAIRKKCVTFLEVPGVDSCLFEAQLQLQDQKKGFK